MLKFIPPKPLFLPPSSALFRKLDEDINYIAQIKINGIRGIMEVRNGKAQIWSRHWKLVKPWTSVSLPNGIYDGEYQQKEGVYWLFDLIRLGSALTRKPLSYRLKLLGEIKLEKWMHHVPQTYRHKIRFYEHAIEEKWEGVVIKKLSSPYPINQKITANWLKIKPSKGE